MASGHVNRTTGRTHGCSDQCCSREKNLANPEPSTHGPSRRVGKRHHFRFRREQTFAAHDARPGTGYLEGASLTLDHVASVFGLADGGRIRSQQPSVKISDRLELLCEVGLG